MVRPGKQKEKRKMVPANTLISRENSSRFLPLQCKIPKLSNKSHSHMVKVSSKLLTLFWISQQGRLCVVLLRVESQFPIALWLSKAGVMGVCLPGAGFQVEACLMWAGTPLREGLKTCNIPPDPSCLWVAVPGVWLLTRLPLCPSYSP